MSADGLWAPSVGTDGIHIATVRALVSQASVRPAMATRAVFVVGDAERMVSQEGADQAANAFLKLLEEPPPARRSFSPPANRVHCCPPFALVWSRCVCLPSARAICKPFSPTRPSNADSPKACPPTWFSVSAERLASCSPTPRPPRVWHRQGNCSTPHFNRQPRQGRQNGQKRQPAKASPAARGAFTDMLDALTILLHERARQLVTAGHDADARRTAIALLDVENAKASRSRQRQSTAPRRVHCWRHCTARCDPQ
jgi:DNA polymerase-3 subunit delta'